MYFCILKIIGTFLSYTDFCMDLYSVGKYILIILLLFISVKRGEVKNMRV